MTLLLPAGEGWDEGRIYLNHHTHEAMLFVISTKAGQIRKKFLYAVIPAEAGIQVLNGSRALRATQKLIAGGSAPAPWVTFLCTDKEKSPKEIRPGWREISLRFSPEPALASTRRAQTTRLGLKHEARFTRFRLRCSGAPYGSEKIR